MSHDIARLRADLVGLDLCKKLAAARALAELGEQAAAAAPELARAAADENDDVREWSTAALEDMGPPPNSALPLLVNLLGGEHDDVAYWAATLIGRLETEAAAAVDALAAALQEDRAAAVRQRAAWALGKIGPPAAAAVSALTAASESFDPRLARLAVQALGQIGRQ